MDVRKTCILLLLISGMAIELYAQQPQRVSGQIWSMAADAKEKESLPYASVLVINEKDSTLVKGTQMGSLTSGILRTKVNAIY